jgi:glutaconate CoA-transferase subunit A
VDIAVAAARTIVTCEELVDDEEMRRHPERNDLTGLCVDAVVHLPFGAHPAQCFGLYDYSCRLLAEYEEASRTEEGFAAFLENYVYAPKDQSAYIERTGGITPWRQPEGR